MDQLVISMKPWAMYSNLESILNVKKGKVVNLEVLANQF